MKLFPKTSQPFFFVCLAILAATNCHQTTYSMQSGARPLTQMSPAALLELASIFQEQNYFMKLIAAVLHNVSDDILDHEIIIRRQAIDTIIESALALEETKKISFGDYTRAVKQYTLRLFYTFYHISHQTSFKPLTKSLEHVSHDYLTPLVELLKFSANYNSVDFFMKDFIDQCRTIIPQLEAIMHQYANLLPSIMPYYEDIMQTLKTKFHRTNSQTCRKNCFTQALLPLCLDTRLRDELATESPTSDNTKGSNSRSTTCTCTTPVSRTKKRESHPQKKKRKITPTTSSTPCTETALDLEQLTIMKAEAFDFQDQWLQKLNNTTNLPSLQKLLKTFFQETEQFKSLLACSNETDAEDNLGDLYTLCKMVSLKQLPPDQHQSILHELYEQELEKKEDTAFLIGLFHK